VFNKKGIKMLLSGTDKDWSSSLIKILKNIPTEYVFIWFDDIFPIGYVETSRFYEAIEFMQRNCAKHIHMQPVPRPDKIVPGGKFGIYSTGAPYRITARGFWKRDYLISILQEGESAWDFEIMGSYRSSFSDGFYCCMKSLHRFLHVVEKGKIFPYAFKYCRRNNIPLDTNNRSIIGGRFIFVSNLKKIYFNLVIRIPWRIRLYIMDIFRKALASY
jgi:hypothetical protein